MGKKQTVKDAKRIMYRAGVALRKRLWEPETINGYCRTEDFQIQNAPAHVLKVKFINAEQVRIIRERDYKKLMALARKAKERGDE